MGPTRLTLVLALAAAACDEGALSVAPASGPERAGSGATPAGGSAGHAPAGVGGAAAMGEGGNGATASAAGAGTTGGKPSGGTTAGSGAAGMGGAPTGASGSPSGGANGTGATAGGAGATSTAGAGAAGAPPCDATTPCEASGAPCQVVSCMGGACVANPVADGTPPEGQKAGDCVRWVCSMGTPVLITDDTDTDDHDACTTITCAAGKATVTQALADGEPCTPGGDGVCHGTACKTLLEVHPAPGTVAPADVPLVLVFTEPMNAASLAAQTKGGACGGTVRYSRDDFSTCVPFDAAQPQASPDGRTLLFRPAAPLAAGRYRVFVGQSATTSGGAALGHDVVLQKETWIEPGGGCMGSVLIASALSTHGAGVALLGTDQLVLHNRGALGVDLYGWSIQVQVEPSSPWKVLELSGVLAPTAAKIIEGAAVNKPDPGALTFGGKGVVALLSTSTPLSAGQCPIGAPSMRDVLGVARPDCDGGAGWSPSTYVERRLDHGCRNTGDPTSDFEVYTPAFPAPKSAAFELPSGCACGGAPNNESGQAAEADACTLLPLGSGTPQWIEASVRHAGRTEAEGPANGIIAQLGFAPKGASIVDDGWLFVDAAFVRQEGESEVYRAVTPTLSTQKALTFSVVARFSFDDGATFTYCDFDGAGKSPGFDFDGSKLPLISPSGSLRPPKIK